MLTNRVNCSRSTFNLTLFWRVVRDLHTLLRGFFQCAYFRTLTLWSITVSMYYFWAVGLTMNKDEIIILVWKTLLRVNFIKRNKVFKLYIFTYTQLMCSNRLFMYFQNKVFYISNGLATIINRTFIFLQTNLQTIFDKPGIKGSKTETIFQVKWPVWAFPAELARSKAKHGNKRHLRRNWMWYSNQVCRKEILDSHEPKEGRFTAKKE